MFNDSDDEIYNNPFSIDGEDNKGSKAGKTANKAGSSGDVYATPSKDNLMGVKPCSYMKDNDLARRKRESEIKEQQARIPETRVNLTSTTVPSDTPNWPNCKPVIRHNINADIPAEAKGMAKRSYFLWQISFLGYTLNLAAAIGFLASGVDGYQGIGGLLLSILYLVIMPPLAFYFWHLTLYKALIKNSTALFIAYFTSYGIHILFCVFLGIGFFAGGGGGLIGMIAMFNNNLIVQGVISAICAGVMFTQAILGVLHFRTVGKYYRNGGHTLSKARNEVVTAAAKNEHVQKAAFNTAKDAAFQKA